MRQDQRKPYQRKERGDVSDFKKKKFIFRKMPLNSVTVSQAPILGLGTFVFFQISLSQKACVAKTMRKCEYFDRSHFTEGVS